MATGTYTPEVFEQFTDDNGNPLSSGNLYTYVAGTTTAATTYSDVGLTTPNANPVPLNAAGRPTSGAIFLVPGQSYKFVLKDSGGATIATRDNITAVPASSAGVDVAITAGEALTAGIAIYQSDGSGGKTAGQWYKADSANAYSSSTPEIAMTTTSVSAAATSTARMSGTVPNLTSLTPGAFYYVGTAGAITTTAPANKRVIGQADSATSLVLGRLPDIPLTGIADGAIPIGKASDHSMPLATITAGSGVSVTNGAGAITLAWAAYDKTLTEASVGNTNVETTIYTKDLPANTLTAGKGVRITMAGNSANASGGSINLTIKGKLGSTVFYSTTLAIPTALTIGPLGFQAIVTANNASNSQRAYGNVTYSLTNTTDGVAEAAANTLNNVAVHTAMAVDMTTTQTLAITVQWASASATAIFKAFGTFVELVQ